MVKYTFILREEDKPYSVRVKNDKKFFPDRENVYDPRPVWEIKDIKVTSKEQGVELHTFVVSSKKEGDINSDDKKLQVAAKNNIKADELLGDWKKGDKIELQVDFKNFTVTDLNTKKSHTEKNDVALKKFLTAFYKAVGYKKDPGTSSERIHDYALEDELLDRGVVDEYLDVTKHLVITQGEDKMRGISSLNVDPRDVRTCKEFHSNPKYVCSKCYSFGTIEGNLNKDGKKIKGRKPNLGPCFRANGRMLSKKEIPVGGFSTKWNSPSALFRICSHGDIINEIHMRNCVNFLKQMTDAGKITHCCWWSKEHGYFAKIKAYATEIGLDKSFYTLIYSTKELNELSPKPQGECDKVFSVYTYDFLKGKKKLLDKINCGSEYCKTCKGGKCYAGGSNWDIRELLKDDQRVLKKDIASLENDDEDTEEEE